MAGIGFIRSHHAPCAQDNVFACTQVKTHEPTFEFYIINLTGLQSNTKTHSVLT